ncbi:MAG: VIT domain-containing protein [Rhodothermales bacterium]
MKKILLTLLLILIWMPATAQFQNDVLNVRNPQRNWDQRRGTIEEAAISVRPKGIYAEVGVYLTFSDAGAGFNVGEDLEVEFLFTLPEEAIITDSWLWVGDEIVKAQLLDRWTASEIYEGIVNRRQDPSLLIKHGQGNYELRVYPMDGGSSRRVKLTYLLPMRWTEDRVHIPLPFHWLETSQTPIETLFMLAWPDETWTNPYMSEDPEIPVQHFVDSEFGEYDRIDIHAGDLAGLNSLSYDAPLNDGVFVSSLGNTNEGYFQMAYLPSAFSGEESDVKRVALLIDYDATKTLLTSTEILATAKNALQAQLKPTDLFNVLFSQFATGGVTEQWLPATPAVIDSVFLELNTNVLALYTNLPSLLADGISFIDENGGDGSLLVVSSSDALSSSDAANQLIGDLRALKDPLPTMLFADIANTGLTTVDINATVYEGNSYLYTNLARLSGGFFNTIRSGQGYAEILTEFLSGSMGAVQAFDLYSTLENGFTYARFSSNSGFDAVPLNTAVTQVGKYVGDFPFVIEASGIYEGSPFSNRQTYSSEEVVAADSSIIPFWTGNQIEALERGQQDDQAIAEIINYSLQTRVISLYTAFLALEPGINDQQPCGAECEDETDIIPTDVEGEIPEDVEVTLAAYPNPFSSRATIQITFPEVVDLRDATFQVFNAMGQLVKTLQPASSTGRVIEVIWDGTTEAGVPAANGIYFFVMTTPSGRRTLKLVLIR